MPYTCGVRVPKCAASDGDAYKYNGKGKKKRLEAKINSDSDLALVRNGMHDVIYTASTSPSRDTADKNT